MSADLEARLTKVRAAIDAILDGGMSEYDLDGQGVKMLSLAELEQMERRLERRIERVSGRRRVRHGVVL